MIEAVDVDGLARVAGAQRLEVELVDLDLIGVRHPVGVQEVDADEVRGGAGVDRLAFAVEQVRGLAAAARLGLKTRGTIRDGNLADLVVFDPATIRSHATYDEPRRFPTGIDHVIVNGTLVVRDGEHTGATPGRAIRLGVD